MSALRDMNIFVVEDLTHFVQLASRSDNNSSSQRSNESNEVLDDDEEEVDVVTVAPIRPAVPGRGGKSGSVNMNNNNNNKPTTAASTYSSNTQRLFDCVRSAIRIGVQLGQPIEKDVQTILALLLQLCERSKSISKVPVLIVDAVALTALETIPFLEHCLSTGSTHSEEIAVSIIKVANALTKVTFGSADASILQLLIVRVAYMLRSVFRSLPVAESGVGDKLFALQLQAMHDTFKLTFADPQTIPREIQTQVVDLFYYCPFDNSLAAEAVKIGNLVCSSAVDSSVQTHFIRLLTER